LTSKPHHDLNAPADAAQIIEFLQRAITCYFNTASKHLRNMSSSTIGGLLAFVEGEIECCKDEKYRLKEKRNRLEGLRDALMAAQAEPVPASTASSSSSSSSSESKSGSKKKDKKRKAEESVGCEDDATPTKGDGMKKKMNKEKKDPNKPTRAPSAYNFFMKMEGSAYKLAHPETVQKDIMAVVGGLWKGLSDKDKEPFTKQAEDAKAAAAVAMEAYNKEKATATASASAAANDSDSD